MMPRGKNAATLIILFAAILLAVALPRPRAAYAAPHLQTLRMPPPVEYRASGVDTPLYARAPQRSFNANAAATSMVVNFLGAGTTNAFGDTCTAWPASAMTAFNAATAIWAASIVSSVPIKTNACWTTSLGSGVLGHSGPSLYPGDTAWGAAGYYYPTALANALAHTDFTFGDAEFDIGLSSSFSWYEGTDGIVPSGKYDMESVVLHELGHGLGFLGLMDDSGGEGYWVLSSPSIYDRFTKNGSGARLIDFSNPSTTLGSQLTGNNIYFDGPKTRAANGGNPAKLYAPSTWNAGSSYSHLDEIYNGTPNALMTYSLGTREAIHDPGPIMLGVLQDMGWTLPAAPVQCYTLTVNASPSSAGSVNVSPASNCSGAGYSEGTVVTLTAHPNTGYYFFGWVGIVGTGTSPTQVTLNDNENITAIFDTYTGPVPSTRFLPLVHH
jgi:hypothetical protein